MDEKAIYGQVILTTNLNDNAGSTAGYCGEYYAHYNGITAVACGAPG